jgi:hypothetical protein
MYVKQWPAYPKGRSQALSSAFLATFEEHGGTARMNCGVDKITTRGGLVSSAITEQGEEITANGSPLMPIPSLLAARRSVMTIFQPVSSLASSPAKSLLEPPTST